MSSHLFEAEKKRNQKAINVCDKTYRNECYRQNYISISDV